MEVHPEPDKALCDGPNMIPIDDVPDFLRVMKQINYAVLP
jgi:2-dehydro-3-deoxyphosphooctonate aldolase (KDO 8-P synthase)